MRGSMGANQLNGQLAENKSRSHIPMHGTLEKLPVKIPIRKACIEKLHTLTGQVHKQVSTEVASSN